ncbi:hypothetical protein SLEP1_g60437 [Rubroshorea leprosula]|uniref:Disease resistance protein At4g27190-like leucine-rich repeats domain-containing protein n=1 Tax=Rubroshorea leprosula TaxID=152421 RepID=A0AAV5MZ18_9ROSI|nr:hypothetical protein SLEP1_g60437 [Rubroshorea leprosula]
MIWQSKVHADSFSKLKSLRVENCEKLLTIFPSTEAAFLNLEQLTITQSKNLKMIWRSKAAFLNLEQLTITQSKNLKMIWQSKVHANSFSKLK